MAGPTDAELIIETPDGVRYAVRDLGKAQKRFPGLTVVSYADGRPFEEKPARKRSPAKRKAAAATVPAVTGPDPATGDTSDGTHES